MPASEQITGIQTGRLEGVTVIGEALRRVAPESAEILIEITASAPTAAQAIHDNQTKTAQVAQAATALGVQQADIQSISVQVYNFYPSAVHALPGYQGVPQIGRADVPPGGYHARNILRVNVREPARTGEIVDAAVRAGGTIAGAFSLAIADETQARKHALEAAAKDARARAEPLATAIGKKVGDPVAITEEVVASDGALTALRSAIPLGFGPALSRPAGELEYYARVSVNFRFQ